MKKILFIILVLSAFTINAQPENIIYDDYIYQDYIKSVSFTHAGLKTSLPIIDFETNFQGKLKLGFDDLEGGYKTYIYRIIHCDKDWFPSEIDEIEYLDGFNNEEIEEFAYSVNSYSDYTHYEVYLPNDDINWTISGNYIIAIFDEEFEVPVLTRRFMVAETNVDIRRRVMKPRNVQKINTHQEVEIMVNHKKIHISRPKSELFVSVLQNGNWNSAISNIQGSYEIGDVLHFDQYDQIVFPALKEFRSFDIRSLKYRSPFVHSIDQDSKGTTVLLDLNKKRSNRNFLSEEDANGFFIISNADYNDGDVSSEYASVIFTLQSPQKFEEDLFIIGAFSDWQAKEEYLLEYDEVKEIYFGAAVFKQGYYDYMFALQREDGYLDIDKIEGSWYETENDYIILVYYRAFGSYYDRLLGVANFNSNPSN